MSTLAINEIKGVIFDMDGVLFDTEVLYERFWCEAARQFGFVMTPEHVAAIRSTDSKVAEQITKKMLGQEFDYYAIRELRKKLMGEYVDREGIQVKPGVKDTLEFFQSRGMKIALATTSNKKRAEKYLTLAGVRNYFHELVCGDMIERGKPDPMIYEIAARRIGLLPGECYAFEDSHNGVRSAYRAGCHTIMVLDRDLADEEMREKSEMVLRQMDEIICKKM